MIQGSCFFPIWWLCHLQEMVFKVTLCVDCQLAEWEERILWGEVRALGGYAPVPEVTHVTSSLFPLARISLQSELTACEADSAVQLCAEKEEKKGLIKS